MLSNSHESADFAGKSTRSSSIRVKHFVCSALCALVLCAGCATSPVTNSRLERFDTEKGYRARTLAAGENNSDSLLVILTFSGGGTRAAAMAYGVLEQLRDTPIEWEGTTRSLLDEVDIISSVSGGSLPAAYYSLFGKRIFEDFPEKVLYENIQGGLMKRILLPPGNLKTLSPLFTRTDVMADSFDHNIFENKTYADLIEKNQRPYLIVNATDMAKGHRFEFTQDQFDHLYSDLGSYHIGHAVAASACYPGAFPPMTVRNYERGEDYAMPEWAQNALEKCDAESMAYRQARRFAEYGEPNHPYVHLSDGGIADNLGLLPIIFLLRRVSEGYGPSSDSLYAKASTILVLTVNAAVKPPRPWDMVQSPIGLVSTLFSAGTTPMSNFTSAQMEYLKLMIEYRQLRAELIKLKGTGDADHNPDLHFVEVSFDRVKDNAERDVLNSMPTSFSLQREQVDHLRAASAGILRDNAQFQEFLAGLKPTQP